MLWRATPSFTATAQAHANITRHSGKGSECAFPGAHLGGGSVRYAAILWRDGTVVHWDEDAGLEACFT